MIGIVDDVRLITNESYPDDPNGYQTLVTDGTLVLVPETKVIDVGDLGCIGSTDEGRCYIEESDYDKEMTIIKPFIVTKGKNILEGDSILIEYTHGMNGVYDYGILTKIWDEDEGPYCWIDYKEIDLAGEGHSSNTFKILADPLNFPDNYNEMIVQGKLNSCDLVSLQCNSITREELREITHIRLDVQLRRATEDEEEKINNTKRLFDTLTITSEMLDEMKVVKRPIFIEEWENGNQSHEITPVQQEHIDKWDGEKCLTLNPDGSVGFKTRERIKKEEEDATLYWAATTELDDLQVPKEDDNGNELNIIGRIRWLKANANKVK